MAKGRGSHYSPLFPEPFQAPFSSGVDRTYISELENDLKSPTVDTLERLCKAMGVKASQILAKAEAAGRGKKAKGTARRESQTVRLLCPNSYFREDAGHRELDAG